MTDAVQVALIVAIAPTLTSLAALISSIRNHEKISKIEQATNGMHDKLIVSAKKEGEEEGRALQKLEHENENGRKTRKHQ